MENGRSIKYPCYLEFSGSGKHLKIVHKNGHCVAELIVHGSFARRTLEIHRFAAANHAPAHFEGELFQLADYEFILGEGVAEK